MLFSVFFHPILVHKYRSNYWNIPVRTEQHYIAQAIGLFIPYSRMIVASSFFAKLIYIDTYIVYNLTFFKTDIRSGMYRQLYCIIEHIIVHIIEKHFPLTGDFFNPSFLIRVEIV